MTKKLIVIAGPTASGKTKVSIELAQKLNTEIISADSRQIYKEMTIGTAVPSKEELSLVPHHFIQNKSIHDYYNASKYEFEVLELLKKLFLSHDKILLVGGSGLYINAVIDGIDDLPEYDPALRNKLQLRIENEGLDSLRKELKILDPDCYNKIDLKNPKRIQKALEICLLTSKPYSDFMKNTAKNRPFEIKNIAINLEREDLYQKINKRVTQMIKRGLVEEAKNLYPYRELSPLKTVGYREIFNFLDKETDLDKAIELIQNNSRKYARKQITWFRKNNRYKWFHPNDIQEILKYINEEQGYNKIQH